MDLRGRLNAGGSAARKTEEGADYLIIQSNMLSSAMLAEDLRALKLRTKMICLNWEIDEMWLDLVKEVGEGVYDWIPYALWSDENLPGRDDGYGYRKF